MPKRRAPRRPLSSPARIAMPRPRAPRRGGRAPIAGWCIDAAGRTNRSVSRASLAMRAGATPACRRGGKSRTGSSGCDPESSQQLRCFVCQHPRTDRLQAREELQYMGEGCPSRANCDTCREPHERTTGALVLGAETAEGRKPSQRCRRRGRGVGSRERRGVGTEIARRQRVESFRGAEVSLHGSAGSPRSGSGSVGSAHSRTSHGPRRLAKERRRRPIRRCRFPCSVAALA
jgi:hypothetical protein